MAVLGVAGVLIGVANIIPGVSGGTMAVILKVFDRMIEALSLKNLKQNWLFILCVGVGAGVGILAFSKAIKFLLLHYPMATNFTFIGLILGSIPMIFKRAKEGSKQKNGTFAPLSLGVVCGDVCADGGAEHHQRRQPEQHRADDDERWDVYLADGMRGDQHVCDDFAGHQRFVRDAAAGRVYDGDYRGVGFEFYHPAAVCHRRGDWFGAGFAAGQRAAGKEPAGHLLRDSGPDCRFADCDLSGVCVQYRRIGFDWIDGCGGAGGAVVFP